MKAKDFLWGLLAIVMAATLSVGLSSCSKDDDPPSITASPNGSTNFDINGGDRDIDVTSNTKWSVKITVTEGDEGWLTANTTSGEGGKTITVTASKNNTVKSRKAMVKFTCTSSL